MSTEKQNSVGERIKKTLKDRGLNQSAIAKKMNVSKQVINQIDRRKYFDLEFLTQLSEASGIDFINFVTPPSHLREPNFDYDNISKETSGLIEMSLSIKFKAGAEEVTKFAELMKVLKSEAIKKGFSII